MSQFAQETSRRFVIISLLATLTPISTLALAEGHIVPAMARLQALDMNADGQISQFELATGPVAQTVGMRLFLARHFKVLDRNRDGQVSEAELEAWRQRYEVSETSLSRSLSEDPRAVGDRRDLALQP